MRQLPKITNGLLFSSLVLMGIVNVEVRGINDLVCLRDKIARASDDDERLPFMRDKLNVLCKLVVFGEHPSRQSWAL